MGEGEGRGFTVNVPLPAGSGEDIYAAAFAGVFLPVLREYGPEVILISAGFDAHADDLLGGMALRSDSFGRFAALISDLSREVGAAPPAFVLEGRLQPRRPDRERRQHHAGGWGESPGLGVYGRDEAHPGEPRGPRAVLAEPPLRR